MYKMYIQRRSTGFYLWVAKAVGKTEDRVCIAYGENIGKVKASYMKYSNLVKQGKLTYEYLYKVAKKKMEVAK